MELQIPHSNPPNTLNSTSDVWSLIELTSLYTVPLNAVNGLSRLNTTSNGQAGTADSKIFDSAHHFRVQSNQSSQFEFESNLEASQVPVQHVLTVTQWQYVALSATAYQCQLSALSRAVWRDAPHAAALCAKSLTGIDVATSCMIPRSTICSSATVNTSSIYVGEKKRNPCPKIASRSSVLSVCMADVIDWIFISITAAWSLFIFLFFWLFITEMLTD